jgi:hypothetical protein
VGVTRIGGDEAHASSVSRSRTSGSPTVSRIGSRELLSLEAVFAGRGAGELLTASVLMPRTEC